MCSKWCSGSEPGAADGMCTDSKGDLTRFPTDVVIKADMLFPCVKNTSLPGAKSDWARCEGPAQGARPQPGKPTDPQQDCGSANWPQIPPGFSEGGTKMRGKKKKEEEERIARWKNCRWQLFPEFGVLAHILWKFEQAKEIFLISGDSLIGRRQNICKARAHIGSDASACAENLAWKGH